MNRLSSPSSLRMVVLALALLSTLVFSSSVLAQHYNQTNLVSDIAVTPAATVTDPNLRNPWGLVASPGSPWWVANNASGTSTLYSVTNANPPVPSIVPLVVKIANAPSQTAQGSPTGVVFNGSATDFFLNGQTQPAHFIFATEDGTIQGWNSGTAAVIKVDNSEKPDAGHGAVYKGATIVVVNGKRFLLVTNFRSGHVEEYDTNFKRVGLATGAFALPSWLPPTYAPFNIQGIGDNVYVTFARQDPSKHDNEDGPGRGFVEVYSVKGAWRAELQRGSWFNAPWGITMAPANFGQFSHALLVGQFGGGSIAAFNPVTGRFLGNVLNPDGSTLIIHGLWALAFGNNAAAGSATTLFFTAGLNDETDGLFGTLNPIAAEQDGHVQ